MEDISANQDSKAWVYLHERELNLDPVDSENGLLWRILFAQLNSNKYCAILTIHHAIVDGRNAFAILDQLLVLIEKSILKESIDFSTFKVNPSIEEKLYNNDETKLKAINPNPKFEISPENKISLNFKPTKENVNEFISKFTCFSIDQIILDKLLNKCKLNKSKLTGCLNLICSLATYDLYVHYGDSNLAKNICFHFLANLRPFLDIGNLNMGYWPVVLNGIVNTENIQKLDDEFFREHFWSMAKYESDLIHQRIEEKELIENAKMDTLLLGLIDQDFKFENGSVHFAMSNLGSLQSSKSNIFNVKELYYNTSTVAGRWTAVVFHGLSSINNTLCWSLGYNSDLVDDKCIDYLINSIKNIIRNAIAEQSKI